MNGGMFCADKKHILAKSPPERKKYQRCLKHCVSCPLFCVRFFSGWRFLLVPAFNDRHRTFNKKRNRFIVNKQQTRLRFSIHEKIVFLRLTFSPSSIHDAKNFWWSLKRSNIELLFRFRPHTQSLHEMKFLRKKKSVLRPEKEIAFC